MLSLVFLGLLILPCLLVGGGAALIFRGRRRAVVRWSALAYLLLVLLFFLGIGPYLAAYSLVHAGSRPMDRRLQDGPADYHVGYEDIAFEARDGLKLSGWFVPPKEDKAIIIGTHGLFRNRHELLARSMTLTRSGYGMLLYDSRSHGASQPGMVTLGFNERSDVLGAMQYIRRRYQDALQQPEIVFLGVSMGASAVLEAAAETRGYSAIILDSPFASLRETVTDHVWLLFRMPRVPIASLFLFWFKYHSGLEPDRVNAHQALQKIAPVPLLIIASEGDQRMGASVARSLFAESPAPRKRIQVFGKDVTHGAAARLHPEEYNRVVCEFLQEALPQAAKPEPAISSNGTEGFRK